jgi:hypothetical protein
MKNERARVTLRLKTATLPCVYPLVAPNNAVLMEREVQTGARNSLR